MYINGNYMHNFKARRLELFRLFKSQVKVHDGTILALVPFIFLFACWTVLNEYPYLPWLKNRTGRTGERGDGYAKVGI